MTSASADTVWVLCQPDSYVNIRGKASSHSEEVGYALCGDSFETDGTIRNGYIHVYAPVEAGEGWISNGFAVWSEPEELNQEAVIDAKGRVALRRSVNGDRREWKRNGDKLQVYWISDLWAVTDHGFVKTEFLLFER